MENVNLQGALKNLELIIFDLGGVILDIDYELTRSAFVDLGVADADHLYSQASQTELFDDLEKGIVSPAEFRDGIRDLIGLKIADDEVDRAWNALLLDLPVERLAFIQDLKKSYKTCLLSNTNEIHIACFEKNISDRGMMKEFNDSFDQIYYSSRIGKRKPDAEAFQHVLDDFGLRAGECLFIDDSEQHIRTANTMGIGTVHLSKGLELQKELDYLIS